MSEAQAMGNDLPAKPKSRKLAILGMGLLFFVILAIVALILCDFRVKYVSQSILNQQRDAQQTWMDKSLDSIRVWRNELLEQARHISSAELFRLFVIDAKAFTPAEIEALADPDTLHSPDDSLRGMAEQATYIQDLLKDFTRRRAWNDARILLPDGKPLVEPRFSVRLLEAQSALARKAGESGRTIFGPIRRGEKGLVMDVADPLFDVLGSDNSRPLAVLLLSVPMEKTLASFLSRTGEQRQTISPRIAFMEGEALKMALSVAGAISVENAAAGEKLESLPFGPRKSLGGKDEVYSMGSTLTGPDWLFDVETPASEIHAIIDDQKMQIYGLGILSSVGIALLAAFIWAALTSRSHEARARQLERLYTTIRNQKLMLDSVNASLQAGLLLVDSHARAQMANPAFDAICGRPNGIAANTPITDIFPAPMAIKFREKMAAVKDSGQPADVELLLPGKDRDGKAEDRLYRVSLFPYSETGGKGLAAGCVAIFQDITEFRRRSERARARQTALVSSLVRAIESVDPNLVGHSDKMEALAKLLGGKIFTCEDEAAAAKDNETLRIAAQLSQVGRIFVKPHELLTKQNLTPEELAEVRRAPQYADKILHELHFDLPVRETVHQMGLRMKDGCKNTAANGEELSLAGRALAIINSFIAMTSPRAWRADRKPLSIEQALEELRKEAGFDEDVVNALASIDMADLEKIVGHK